MSWLIRLSLLCSLAVTATGSVALAEDATESAMPEGQTLEINTGKFPLIHGESSDDGNREDLVAAGTTEKYDYFNAAHCQCAKADLGDDTRVGFEVRRNGGTLSTDRPVDFWGGTSCGAQSSRTGASATCRKLGDIVSPLDVNSLNGYRQVSMRLLDVFAPRDGVCPTTKATNTVFLLVAPARGGEDYTYMKPVNFDFDTQPPPAFASATAQSGEGAIQLDWKYPTGQDTEDVESYQALCIDMTTMGAVRSPAPAADYQTATSLCGAESTIDLDRVSNGVISTPPRDAGVPDAGIVDAGVPDAGTEPDAGGFTDDDEEMFALPPPPQTDVPTAPAAFRNLDPAFICSETGATATGMRIGGLVNGREYAVALVSIDRSKNARGIYFGQTVTPRAVTDIWEDIQGDDSGVEGGYCLIAETYGDRGGPTSMLREFRDDTLAATAFGRALIAAYYDHAAPLGAWVAGSTARRVLVGIALAPVVAVALLWHLLTLPGLLALILAAVWWRRRSRTAFVVRERRPRLAALAAAAGAVLVAVPASAQSSIAPYWEEEEMIDEDAEPQPRWNVGIKVGPYTPGIDQQDSKGDPFDDMFYGLMWLPQLDVDFLVWRGSGQLGIGGSAGYAGKTGKAYLDDDTRSPGDKTSFRMVPLAATATYRATQLDDLYGIPLVPYARGGLAYYIWWMTAPSGNIARFIEADGSTNKAAGASLGLVGAVGLAIRAERLDRDAALSMREGGVQHAGFYVEGSLGWVDGFGSDKKLSLSEATWFGGVNFEF
jgi:hypothetical protein